jgi:hypothetical protein
MRDGFWVERRPRDEFSDRHSLTPRDWT